MHPHDLRDSSGDAEMCGLGVTELGRLYRARELSAVEVAKAVLSRVDRLNPVLNAYISVDPDGALAAAGNADRLFAAGIDVGPMQGVPVSLKDNIHAQGTRTTGASRVLATAAPDTFDAAVAGRLRRAGAVILGKTNLHEFAFGDPDPDSPFGIVQNPRRLGHQPGSSSSGSGAATAAGLGAVAIGTDTAGSIRGPASACGVVGLKPTRGLVPNHGVIPVTPEFDHVGPLARSVADAACALTVLSGWDPGRADGEDFGAALTQNLKGLRLGVPTNPEFFLGTEGALALFEGARRALVARGLVEVDFAAVQVLEATDLLHDVVMPPHVRAHHIAAYGGLSAHGRPFREWAGRADTITAEAYLAARARIDRLTEEWRGHFARFDVALLPGNLHGALPHGQTTITIGGASHPMRRVLSKFNALANMTGCPSLLVPVGTDRGMPISVQIVGPPFADGRVLAVGKALEETFGTVAALGIEPIPAPPAGGA